MDDPQEVPAPDWDAPLASIEGHCSGPGLSWPGLVAVADSVPGEAEGIRDLDRLLLLPVFGDADVPFAEATERRSRALSAWASRRRRRPGSRSSSWTSRSGTAPPGRCWARAR